jgi:large subunit ribosomal protein L14
MIQFRTTLNVVDNTGGRKVSCLKVFKGFKRRYAYSGDTILTAVKTLRLVRKETIKIKKGEKVKALLLRSRFPTTLDCGDSFSFLGQPNVLLFTRSQKIIGTRVFGPLSKMFRFTKYLKVLSIISGIIKV